jgi:hypothetical protein
MMEIDENKIPWEPIEARLREMKRKAPWLADELGVDKNAVYNWPKRGGVPMTHLPKLIKTLGIPADELLASGTVNSPNTEEKTPLSDEAEQLIQCVLRLDGLGELARKTFAGHLTLLTLAEQMLGMQDAEVVRELHIQEQQLASHVDPLRDQRHAKRDHKPNRNY